MTGRFIPAGWRLRLGPPLRLLLAAPYLVFARYPPLPVALTAVVLAPLPAKPRLPHHPTPSTAVPH